MRRSILKAAFVLCLGLASASACNSTILPVKEAKKCQLQVVNMTVLASPMINPTNEGEARPVIVRLYQLKNDVNLTNATFEQIWKDDKNTLGEDIVKSDEFAVYPNSRSEVKFERDDSASYVVAVALFRNPKGKSWFVSFELPPSPAKGECGTPECKGDDCEKKDKEIPQPVFVIWIDGTRIDSGEDHLDDFPSSGRVQVVKLGPAAAVASGKPAGPPPKAGGK
jgi:type VI secretion system protein VasD